MKDLIPYGKQNIDQADIEAVIEALHCSFITQGPRVDEFEQQIADYCGVKHAVAFNSGTSALHAAMFAAGVKSGDEVICSPITFVATSNSAAYLGARPVFVDMDINSYCIDIDKIEQAINQNSKVIVPVDYAGYPVDMDRILKIAKKHNLVVIEDAAHALGAKRAGVPVGRAADMTMFSFHPVKHITTGEGGMIVCNDETYYRRLKLFRCHGIEKDESLWERNDGPWYYEMQNLGYNFRITDIQCALGLSQLQKLPDFLQERNRIARIYDTAFQDLDLVRIPPRPDGAALHAYHIYPLILDPSLNRRKFFDYMRASNIGVQVHYVPVHLQPYYRHTFGYKSGDFPVAENFYAHEISIPIFPGLGEAEQKYIIDKIIAGIS